MCRLLPSVAVIAAVMFPTSIARAQSVDEIVAKNLQAKGGIDLIRQTTSVKMTGRFRTYPPDGQPGEPMDMSMTTWAKRPNLMRREASLIQPATKGGTASPLGQAPPPQGQTSPLLGRGQPQAAGAPQKMIQASDGTVVWFQRGPGRPQTLPPAQAEPMMADAEFDSVFVDYAKRGITIDLVGRETLNGRSVYHLKVSRKNAPVQHYFLDTETGLEAKVATEASQGGVTAKVETEIGDFRNVDGRMVPFKTRQFVDGRPAAEMTIESVEFNGDVPDSLFKIPSATPK